MADKQYVYAVARIRSKELSLLSGAFLEQLTAAKDYDECIQLLMEKGWGEDGMTMPLTSWPLRRGRPGS